MDTTMGTVIVNDVFGGATSNWTSSLTSSSSEGAIRGRFTTELVEKRVDIPVGTSMITVEFDFLEIDSWDGEVFSVFVNGEKIEIGSFRWQDDEEAQTFETNSGILVERAAARDISAGDNTAFWAFNDNAHAIRLTIPNPAESLTLGFTSTLDQALSNESFGINNFKVTAFSEQAPENDHDHDHDHDHGSTGVEPGADLGTEGFLAQLYEITGPASSLADVDFSEPQTSMTVDAINFDAGHGAFFEGGPTDNFAVRFTGAFEVAEAGSYTFYLTSDDGSKLLLNGSEVLGNDGLHAAREESVTLDLTAGSHSLELLYFEAGGQATVDLDWSGPGFGRQQMTLGERDAEQPGGLTAAYFELPGGVSSLSQIDFDAEPIAVKTLSEIDFKVGTGAFYDGGAEDNFAARFSGSFDVETPGSYTFYLTSDDGSALFVDGELVLGNDGLHSAREDTVILDLSEGAHEIEVRYFEAGGQATLDLDWSGPGFAREQMLFPAEPVAVARPEYTTPEEKLKAVHPDMPSIGADGMADMINNSARSWEGGTITFSFPTEESIDYAGTNREGKLFGFGEGQQSTTRTIMTQFQELLGFDVVDLGDSQDAQIRFWNTTIPIGSFGGGLPGEGTKGDMWAHNQDPDAPNHDTKWQNGVAGDGLFKIMLHEIGHTMGLEHTPLKTLQDGQALEFQNVSQHVEGSVAHSLMSYWNYDLVGLNRDAPNPGTLMLADITALHAKYGANMETRTGDSVYGFNSNVEQEAYNYETTLTKKGWTAAFTIWDAGGVDVIDMSGFNESSFISLVDGTYSSTGGFDMNVAIARNAIIENAIGGSGDDQLIGNAVANVLEGAAGKDLLIGDGGADTLVGGAGNDELYGGEAGDTFVFMAGSGVDLILDFAVSEDLLKLEGTNVHSFADLSFESATAGQTIEGHTLTQDATVVSYGTGADGGAMILLGVDEATLDADHFLFV